MPSPRAITSYYDQLQAVPIGNLARELLVGRITRESDQQLACDCPNHQSQSKTSLTIDLVTNRWHCWGCGVGGAPLQLVEFVHSGVCTTKKRGQMPASHREARDFLAKRCGVQPLNQIGKSAEDIARAEQAFIAREACFDTLAIFAERFHEMLLADAKTLSWVQANYGLTLDTIKKLKIGIANYNGEPTLKALADTKGVDRLTGLGTGLFGLTENNAAYPVLRGRVVFPYWRGGRIVSMVGRIVPWDEGVKKQPKYKKLLVHHPQSRSYVQPCMDNSAFYNEDCLLTNPESVLITEGVTDCIAALQHGIPVISPVTVQFREKDTPRLVNVLRRCKQVFLCLDNELSQIGLKGAMKLARLLEEKKIHARIVSLPLGKTQTEARKELASRFGITEKSDLQRLDETLADPTPERLAEVRRLIAAAKIDLNAWFAEGRTKKDFDKVLQTAKPRVEILISLIDTSLDDRQRYEQRKPLMIEIAKQPDYYLDRCLKLIQEHYGKRSITLGALRSELRGASKVAKKEVAAVEKQNALQTQLKAVDPKSCLAAMLAYEMQMGDPRAAPAEGLGKVVAEWFVANGARFFYPPGEEPIMFFDGVLYYLASTNKGQRREFYSFFQEQTGLTHITTKGKVVIETLRNIAKREGKESAPKTWIHTIPEKHTIYFNLNNENHEVARITPDGVAIFKNGLNPDDVVLRGHKRMKPIHFLSDADLDEAQKAVDQVILGNLSCSELDKCFIVAWISCFLLIGFAGTRPKTRFEGCFDSGKTGGSKVITALLYGDLQQKKSTTAANYADAARNPLVALDNIEATNMSQELIDFMLLATSGVSREKVAYGTDSEIVADVTNCLVNSTGIEPLAASLGEVLSRVFTIKFHKRYKRRDYIEVSMVSEIKRYRDLILSALMKRTSVVLHLIQEGKQLEVVRLIGRALGDHTKSRCNDYLSLMCLMIISNETPDEMEAALKELPPSFINMIARFNVASAKSGAEANPIGQALTWLFNAHGQALQADELKGTRISEANFREKYLVTFDTPNRIKDILARDLLAGLKRVSREFGEPLAYKDACQFGVRFRTDRQMIEQAGFRITSFVGNANKRYYTIEKIGDQDDGKLI